MTVEEPKQKIKSRMKVILWTTLPIVLGILLVALILFFSKNTNLIKIWQPRDNSSAILQSLIKGETPGEAGQERPKYFYLNKANEEPKVAALAYLVGDLNTGEVILAKNQDQKFPIASISKLMTALVASEIEKKDETTLVSKKALDTYGTNGNFRLGEKIKTSDLLYPLLLESSNDAAEVLAEHFERNVFVQKMNQQAQNLEMSNTSYADPSGLSKDNQSTVSDIFKLTGYLNQQKQDLIKITSLRSYSNKIHAWSNINKYIQKDGYIGGKTGYTDAAKQTIVSLFSLPLSKSGDRPIAITLLQSPDRDKDVDNILKYLTKNIYYGGPMDASTDWVKEKIGMPSIKEPNFVTLTFGGDLMLTRGVKTSVRKNFNNDYSALFQKSKEITKILQNSDIIFANLEGTVSDKGKDIGNLYSFRMDPEVIPALKGAGISVLSVANNHIGDWGRSAYIDTLARLKENEILYAGGGNNKTEAEQPAIIEKYGMKIGFLGFSDVGPKGMEATTDKAGQLLASDPRFEEIIQNASKQVDYLVVSFHFGDEYKPINNARQQYLARTAVDNGAKIVIGHHPHVIQTTEVYKDAFIAYSLGNFVFDQSWSAPTMLGMLLEIKLSREGEISVRKNTFQLNSAFQPDNIVQGKEEKIKFQEVNTTSQ